MKKRMMWVAVLIFVIAGFCWAQAISQSNPTSNTQTEVQKDRMDSRTLYFAVVVLASVLGLGIVAATCGVAQGIAVGKAVESIARQPEASGKIQNVMLLGLAIIESLTIYVLIIVLILLFVDPFGKYVIG